MASVYKRPGSRFWMARFVSPTGEWTARSTKLTDRASALKLAFAWEGASTMMPIDSPTAAQVDRVVRELWERFSGKRIEHTPTEKFFAQWLATVKTQKAAKTAERYANPVSRFLRHLGERSKVDIKSITGAEVQSFVDSESKRGKSSTTVNLNAKVIRAVFNSALRKGLIERNPLGMVDVPEAIHEDREPMTIGDINQLVDYAKGTDWETTILLGAYLGMRLGDASKVKWDDVDLAQRVVTFIPQKTARKKRKLEIPLHPRIADHLEELASSKAAQLSPFLCPTLAVQTVSGRHGLSFQFADLMAAAGVDRQSVARTGENNNTRKFSKKTFHSLRHTFLSGLANADVPEDVRHKLGGHTTRKVAERYAHINTATMRKAVEKLS